jgi:hypothetical protein
MSENDKNQYNSISTPGWPRSWSMVKRVRQWPTAFLKGLKVHKISETPVLEKLEFWVRLCDVITFDNL